MRGRLHQAAFVVAIPAVAVLVALAPTWRARIGAGVYGAALVGLFGVSAAYHVGTWTEAGRARMRRLDHSMIFVLIAGSYTPLCLLVLRGTTATMVLCAVWAGAIAGVLVKLRRLDLHVLSGFLYVGLGWVAVVTFPALVRALGALKVLLLVTGGVLYTLGALVLAAHRPDPSPRTFGYHEVWHAMTIAAALCHYVVILLVILAL